eukprot:422434_1
MNPKTKEACLRQTKVFAQKTKLFCINTAKAIPPCIQRTKICCKKTMRCMRRLYRKCDIFCGALCSGRTACWINTICFLPVLLFLSIKIYLMPCIQVSLGRLFTLIFCSPCRLWCPEDYIFTDNEFPANIRSLQLEDKTIEKSVLWIRGHELATEEPSDDPHSVELKVCRNEQEDDTYEEYQNKQNQEEYKEPEMYLFRNGINPSDVVQGQLGDCWLLAAIACLAEFPGAIENCFCSYERSERHKYYIKLYDARKGVKRFKKIYIDDYIPCDEVTKRPIFANPKGNELWVLLLEKAFAKFVGNYGRLDGGHTLWAFQAMTGNHCMRFEYDLGEESAPQMDDKQRNDDEEEEEEEEEEEADEKDEQQTVYANGACWRKWLIEYDRVMDVRFPREDYGWIDSGEAFDNKRLWSLLTKYDKHDALIAASATNNGEHKRDDGIVEGHAYTIKQVFRSKKYKLLNIRNPWGHFEWNGKWSDTDTDTWNQHQTIADKVQFVASDDGSFWMEFCDFLKIFNVIEICDRTTISNLHLNVNEDANTKYHLGIAKGCLKGCYEYWLCCNGLRNVYFGRRESSTSTVEVNDKLDTCCPFLNKQDHGHSWNEDVE